MTNAIQDIHAQIKEIIMAAMGRGVADEVLPAAPAPAFVIETPADPSHGDFASNVAMVSAKAFRLPPRKIAEIITQRMDFTGSYIKRNARQCLYAGEYFRDPAKLKDNVLLRLRSI